MTRDSWARSGRPRSSTPAGRAARPAGSWWASVERARESWDQLTGGPAVRRCERHGILSETARTVGECALCDQPVDLVYSDAAAAAILATALGLWSDTAASMGESGPEVDGD